MPCAVLWWSENKLMLCRASFGGNTLLNDTASSLRWEKFRDALRAAPSVMSFIEFADNFFPLFVYLQSTFTIRLLCSISLLVLLSMTETNYTPAANWIKAPNEHVESIKRNLKKWMKHCAAVVARRTATLYPSAYSIIRYFSGGDFPRYDLLFNASRLQFMAWTINAALPLQFKLQLLFVCFHSDAWLVAPRASVLLIFKQFSAICINYFN